jgi:hypothetical protein
MANIALTLPLHYADRMYIMSVKSKLKVSNLGIHSWGHFSSRVLGLLSKFVVGSRSIFRRLEAFAMQVGKKVEVFFFLLTSSLNGRRPTL